MSKEKQLEETIAKLNKAYGKGTVMPMNKSGAADNVDVVSTGNDVLNEATGIGGIPRGRITELYGGESSGKSTLCLQIIAQTQAQGNMAAYIDIENALDMEYAATLGVNVDKLLVSQPSCGEEALEIALALIQSGGVAVVVVDSVAALVPRAELEGEVGDSHMGLMARMMGQFLRKTNDAVKKSDCSLIFINQVREKIGMVFGNPETTPGGRALRFYASLRIELRRGTKIEKSDKLIGSMVKITLIKNKLAVPMKKCEIPLHYGLGFINVEKR